MIDNDYGYGYGPRGGGGMGKDWYTNGGKTFAAIWLISSVAVLWAVGGWWWVPLIIVGIFPLLALILALMM